LACIIILSFSFSAIAAGESFSRGGNLALFVGIDRYEHLGELPYPVNDVRALEKVFSKTGDFRKVIALVDRDENGSAPKAWFQPRKNNILNALRLLAKNAPAGSNLVFFFCGHGMLKEGKAYLMASDSDGGANSAIAMDDVLDILSASKAASKTILVDACPGTEDFPGLSGTFEVADDSSIVITSCQEWQKSLVDGENGRGIFSLAIENALTGAADKDKDGDIDIKELYAHVELHMSDFCLEEMIEDGQNPMRSGMADEEIVLFTAFVTVEEDDIALEDPDIFLVEDDDGGGTSDHTEAVAAVDAELVAETQNPEENSAANTAAAIPEDADDEASRTFAKADRAIDEGRFFDAFTLYRGLAQKGNAEAQYQMGYAYYHGNGLNQDYEKAVEWFTEAGNQGHIKAQETLGSMYYFGQGVKQDLAESARWNMLKGQLPDSIPELKAMAKVDERDYEPTLLTESGMRYYGDIGPALRLKIERPNNEAFSIESLSTNQGGLTLSSSKMSYAQGEEAFLDLRQVSSIPSQGGNYDIYVRLSSPSGKTMTKNVFVKPDATVVYSNQVQQPYQTYQQPNQQYYTQNRQHQQQQPRQSSGNDAGAAVGKFLMNAIIPGLSFFGP
jgi:FOG: TPR repeat, SEL1 subfamily